MPESETFQNPVVREIIKKYEPIWSTYHAGAVLGWDLEVYMPQRGSAHRGLALAHMQLMIQRMTLDLRPLIAKAGKEGDLNDAEKGVLRVLQRDLDYFEKVPPELVEELQKTATEGTVAWRAARKAASFAAFKPYLEKMARLKREEAEKLGYEKHPYDALMNQFEEGLTVADADAVFSKLLPELKRLLEKVQAQGKFTKVSPLTTAAYDESSMRRVNEKIVELLGMPKDRFRMDVSTHPFTIAIARDDVRITTRYEGVNFKATMYSTIHESGHAIYELQIGEDLLHTPVCRPASLGIHESQSRFWENAVGRSKEFVNVIMPTLKENLGFIAGYDAASVYEYLNAVKPSLIRVDADELTYNFHIMLRYEIEKRLLTGEIPVSDLPAVWDDTMEKYLGLRPANDAEGVLQDIHWSQGSMGYFPTYSMGNVLVGVIWRSLRGELAGMVERGEFMQIRGLLRDRLHRHGATYAPKDLLRRSLGTGYDPAPLVEYLQQKFIA
jgi:carboxypeptidase Taq